MKDFKLEERFEVLKIIFIVVFALLFLRLSYVTVIKGDKYYEEAESKVYRKILIEAPRGEIRDRYGRLLAGNRPSFSVMISKNQIQRGKENQVLYQLVSILEKNREEIIDMFPIMVDGNGNYYFSYDLELNEWKVKNEIPGDYDAEKTFYEIVDRLVSSGSITSQDASLDRYELQKLVNSKGVYPPIYVSSWKFSYDVRKEEWLQKYRIKEEEISAQDAFLRIRDYYDIEESMDAWSARKVMSLRDALKLTGYLQYQPVKVAIDISKKTVSEISEKSIDMSGVNVEIEPIRYYPNGNTASHVLGQIGKISRDFEIEKYLRDPLVSEDYNVSDLIGKSGIEKTFEDILHGKKGYKQVQVDSSGRLIKEIGRKSPVSGDTVYLTIDMDLQKVAEESLEMTLKTIQSGGTYQSPYGNVRLRDSRNIFTNATSGAVVVEDVKTGEILAIATYPDYDPNLFATGISSEDMQKLLPENKNDLLAPRPLYNISTMTAVQPGSVFKMVSGMAALEAGLDPYYTIRDKGFIRLGNRNFGCWIWNDRRGSHGDVNIFKALEESCNYYFYSISAGYDYSKNRPLPVNVGVEDILNMSILFGLNDSTGIEIEETAGSVPSEEKKLATTKRGLKYDLQKRMKEAFVDISSDSEEYKEKIDTIVSWTEENPGRGEIIKRLTEMKVKEERVYDITDVIKYSYFNRAKWTTGDKFNLAIGQGENAYTPLQIANYIAQIANGGYKTKVTLVDKIESSETFEITKNERVLEKLPVDPQNISYIKQGMLKVSQEGTARNIFSKFPVKIGGKTGTAQKSGKIPVKDEYQYLLDNMYRFNVNNSQAISMGDKYEKEDQFRRSKDYYLRKAIFELNPRLTMKDINASKDNYDNFGWFVSFAPYEDPQIAVSVLIFQGGHGGYGGVVARDVIAEYMGLNQEYNQENSMNFEGGINP